VKPALLLVAISAFLLLLPPGSVVAKNASIGIYAIVEHVTFDPENAPNFVRIAGVFVVPARMSSGSYRSPQKGYLYFRIAPGMEEAVRRDWNALKVAAGTGKVVAFGEYWVPNSNDPQGNPHHSLEVRVRAEGDRTSPDVYPIPRADGVIEADSMLHDVDHDPQADKIAVQLQEASHH
jgi:hypothetical protein